MNTLATVATHRSCLKVCHLTLGLKHTDDIVVGQRVEEEEIALLETMVFSQCLGKEGGQ